MISTVERTELPAGSGDLSAESNEFNYRPVPVLAPVSLCIGLVAAVGMLGLLGLAVPLIGTILGGLALLKIVRSEGEYGGYVPAITGFALSAFFFLFGTAYHAYAIATEVPEGYRRINFNHDISKKEFVIVDGELRPHPDVAALDGQKVFLKGYMYPPFKTEDLEGFIFVKDSGSCCHGGNPALTDMISVKMVKGKTADYSRYLVAVGGTFRVHDPRLGGELKPVYELEADHVERSKTPF